MNFDTAWVHFEQKHGPQTFVAKLDAEFWFNKGVAHAEPVVNELHQKIEDLKEQLSEHKEN